MTVDSYISNLYNQGIVSGSTFLYCVENSIDTVNGLLAIADNIPNDVMSDITYLKSEFNIPDPVQDNNGLTDANAIDTNTAPNAKIGYAELYSLYQELKYENDTRTINRLNYIESTYSDKEEFIKYLNGNYHSFVELEMLVEEGCVAPFFIEEDLKIEKVSENAIVGQVQIKELLGHEASIHFTSNGVDMTASISTMEPVAVGDSVTLHLDSNKLHVFDAETEQAISHAID